MRLSKNFSLWTLVVNPAFYLLIGGAVIVAFALTGCSHAPLRDRCLWLSPLGYFRCEAKDGSFYSLKPPEAKNLVCYEPEEDSAFIKYCGDK